MTSLTRRAAPLAIGLALIVAACGGGDDDAAASPAPTPEPTAAPTVPPTTTPASSPTPAPDPIVPPADPDRTVEAGDAISVHYVGTLDDGEQFDSSRERGEPLSFVVDSGQMIAGFDAAVRGMRIGETKTVRIEAADAYGEWSEDNVISVTSDQVPDDVAVGDELFSSVGQRFLVLEISAEEVRLDGNHRLAGEALIFEIELVSFDN